MASLARGLLVIFVRMQVLLICFFWLVISLHVVGGAVLFQRWFDRESPWYGFIVPAFAFIFVLNFIEHWIALPSLIGLLPVTLGVSLWAIFKLKPDWKSLRLPAGIFLTSFAFTLLLRALKPSIFNVSSGTYDLPLVASFCMGSTLPPSFSWFPPHDIGQYYALVHYSASVLIRLLDVDVGTGFNLSSALLSAWLCFASSAIAWRVSRQRAWITILAAVIVECAANGASAFLCLTLNDKNPFLSSNLFNTMDNTDNKSPLLNLITPLADYYGRRELEIPGFWSWSGTYHATNGGQFLTLLSVWSLVEVLRRRASNWPWICLMASPIVMVVTSTWGVPFVGTLMVAGLGTALVYRIYPQSFWMVLKVLVGMVILLGPTLMEFSQTRIGIWRFPNQGETHTQYWEFLVDWWPVLMLWLTLPWIWRKLSPGIKIIWLLTPVFYVAVEYYTIGARVDTTGKLWGFLWGMAWSVMFPVIAIRRGYAFRFLTLVLLLSNFITLYYWMEWTWKTTAWKDDAFTLEGTGQLHSDPVQDKILKAVSSLHKQVLFTGIPGVYSTNCGIVANFTHNYSYVDSTCYTGGFFCPGTLPEALQRNDSVLKFYHGKISDPVTFLRMLGITGVIIWPEDHIEDAVLADLKRRLIPTFEYQDFREGDAPNAGVFIFHPAAEQARHGPT